MTSRDHGKSYLGNAEAMKRGVFMRLGKLVDCPGVDLPVQSDISKPLAARPPMAPHHLQAGDRG